MKYSGRTVTAIVEFPNDRILLVKRATAPFTGFWALPGGRLEVGETIGEAVLREVMEETGLRIAIVRKIGEYHEQGIHEKIEYDYYPACFIAKPAGGSLLRQESEIQEIKLFSLTEIPKKLAFKHDHMIRDYLGWHASRR